MLPIGLSAQSQAIFEQNHEDLVAACQDSSNDSQTGNEALDLLRNGASLFGTSLSEPNSNALTKASNNTLNKVLVYLEKEKYYPAIDRITYYALFDLLPCSLINIIMEYNPLSGQNQIERILYGREEDHLTITIQVFKINDVANFQALLNLGFDWKKPMYGLTRQSKQVPISLYDYMNKITQISNNIGMNFSKIHESIVQEVSPQISVQKVTLQRSKKRRRFKQIT